jgi:biopolymer transport protein ExbD
MKIGSPFPIKKARIEIIPLIDIMFFLLAAFMMASLSMIKLQSIRMNLPTATLAAREMQSDILNIVVDRNGDLFVEKKPVGLVELESLLANKLRLSTNFPVYISGDRDATHGSVIRVLDTVRRAGIERVSFAVSLEPKKK